MSETNNILNDTPYALFVYVYLVMYKWVLTVAFIMFRSNMLFVEELFNIRRKSLKLKQRDKEENQYRSEIRHIKEDFIYKSEERKRKWTAKDGLKSRHKGKSNAVWIRFTKLANIMHAIDSLLFLRFIIHSTSLSWFISLSPVFCLNRSAKKKCKLSYIECWKGMNNQQTNNSML